MNPPSQLQHRLPQVYLKPFGYRQNGRWYISVLDMSKDYTEQKLISKFTAEENIFDYTILQDLEDQRHFEKLCSKFEAQYPYILEAVKKGAISKKEHAILCNFMATLIARAKNSRLFYKQLIETPATKSKFFDEITMFNEDKRSGLDIFASTYNIDETVRYVSVVAGEHIVKVLSRLQFTILKSPTNDGKRWFTSDNPVVIDKQNNYGWLIPPEAEIYFPISKEYCFFFYHEQSEIQDHPLRNLEREKVHQCDEVSHAFISWKIMRNLFQHLVIPTKLEQRFDPPSSIVDYLRQLRQ